MKMNDRNDFFSRMCGEEMTNREIVLVHGILLAIGVGAVVVDSMPMLAIGAIAIAGVCAWILRR